MPRHLESRVNCQQTCGTICLQGRNQPARVSICTEFAPRIHSREIPGPDFDFAVTGCIRSGHRLIAWTAMFPMFGLIPMVGVTHQRVDVLDTKITCRSAFVLLYMLMTRHRKQIPNNGQACIKCCDDPGGVPLLRLAVRCSLSSFMDGRFWLAFGKQMIAFPSFPGPTAAN